ncbi:MAG: autotransporter outer membrane beta-barrel domain-containing protein [Bdellovibrionaceae bacterium]|nr:autotransporter outer membrane beta-barrel domain-containing protein [Pseudobdellovibrionaceae bacterium]
MTRLTCLLLAILIIPSTSLAQIRPRSESRGKKEQPIPQPVKPDPLPALPPPLAEQLLPFPVRYIDRPFTLPAGLHELSLLGGVASAESLGHGIQALPYLTEFEYRQPLTNDLTLVWNPLPLGVLYQPKRTETTVTGVSWSVGWQHLGNVGAKPQFISYLRTNMNKASALEMRLNLFMLLPFDKASSLWSGAFRIGPVFQQSDRLALSPRLAVSIDNLRLESVFREDRTPIESRDVTSETARLTFPFSFWIGWSISPRFDLNLEYTLLGSGFRSGTYTHLGTMSIAGRW